MILSANVNGFGDSTKRREFLQHIKKVQPDIICLIDTRFSEQIHRLIENETNHYCFFNSFNSNARGIAVLVKKTCPISIVDTTNDNTGNVLFLKCNYEENQLLLGVIYGPNNDDPTFFNDIFSLYANSGMTDCIFIGDFNVTLNHELDNYGYVMPRNVRARRALNENMTEYGFFDSYRELFGETNRDFTWVRKGGPQRARLDMAIASNSLLPYIKNFEKFASFNSDHNPIILTLDYAAFSRGRGLWKHNQTLLKDMDYVNRINKTIKTTCAKYYDLPEGGNFYENCNDVELEEFLSLPNESFHNLNYSINPHLLLDMLQNDIRNETISYSTAKHRIELSREKELYDKYKKQQEKLEKHDPTYTEQEYLEAESNYTDFIDSKTAKLFRKTQTLNKIYGEKPTKFFCNLEKNFNAQKYIPKLKITKNGVETIITDQQMIDKETGNYYEDLYENKDYLLTMNVDEFLGPGNLYNKLNTEQITELESEITLQELSNTLKHTRNDSSPGSSGFTFGFYKFFWGILGPFILKAALYSFEIGKLQNSQAIGIISLIPKGDKPKELLDSWRPITLLNCIYKLISGVLANRINKVLPNIIHSDQSGFVPGRYIGDCLRSTYDIIEWAKNNKKTGLLLLIDFKKAFDSISFRFIEKTLFFFGFGPNYVKWINILLHNFKASMNHAGNISPQFNIARGCRQGDPIAAALFILAIEILCIKLRNSTEVKGFKIHDKDFLLSLYADDCSIFLEYNALNLSNVISILNSFFLTSGLQIQLQKTQCVVFGKIPAADYVLCTELGLKWDQNFKLLGIKFDGTLSNIGTNYDEKINDIRTVMKKWQCRFISPLGRACIVKTLVLSKLSHLAFVLPSLNKQKLKIIDSEVYKFIWQGKEKVSKLDSKYPEDKGGLNFPDIAASWKAFKFSWFRRLVTSESAWKNIFILNLTKTCNLSLNSFLCTLGTVDYNNVAKKYPSSFWSECIRSISPLMLEQIKLSPEKILTYPIWGSSVFIKGHEICKRDYFGNIGILIDYPIDIIKLTENGLSFLSSDEFYSRYGEVPDNFGFTSIKVVIRMSVQKLGLTFERLIPEMPMLPPMLRLIHMSKSGCSYWSKMFKKLQFSRASIQDRERKWEMQLNSIQGLSFWERCYSNYKELFFDNRIKWFFYQIVRGTLKTNRIVSKFVPGIQPFCTFCNSEIETIIHLFWDCNNTSQFLNLVFDNFSELWPGIQGLPSRNEFIFGIRNEKIFSPKNYLTLYVKYFIWIIRCKQGELALRAFKSWFKKETAANFRAFGNDPRLSFLHNPIYRMET